MASTETPASPATAGQGGPLPPPPGAGPPQYYEGGPNYPGSHSAMPPPPPAQSPNSMPHGSMGRVSPMTQQHPPHSQVHVKFYMFVLISKASRCVSY
jgi:hypothetical protein